MSPPDGTDSQKRWRYLKEYGIPAAIGAVVATCTQQAATWLYTALPAQTRWTIIVAGTIVTVLISRVTDIRALIDKHRTLSVGVLVTVAGFTTSLIAAPGLIRAAAPCPAPAEIRLVTDPENLPEVRKRAGQYVAANRVRGCLLLRMTVAAVPPPVHLRDAFSNDWERAEERRDRPYARLYGLQPDAWVATTSTGPGEVRAHGLDWPHAGGSYPLVGRDQLVLAMDESHHTTLSTHMKNPADYPLEEVWRRLRDDLGMTIARPFPETSMSGLVVTGDLHRALGLSRTQYSELERELAAEEIGADTVTSLLCAFNRLSGPSGAPKVALLVPGHSVADYNASLIDACPGTGQRRELRMVRHPEFSALDYRYVSVPWSAQSSPQRRKLVDGFGDWLQQNPLFPGTPVDSRVRASGSELTELRRLLLDELRRELDLRLLVDISGSADRPLRVRAAEALRGQGRILGQNDHIQVYGLGSRRAHGRAETPALTDRSTRTQLGAVADRLEQTGFSRWDAPVSAGLSRLGGDDRAAAAPVLLLTDGRLSDDESGDAPAAIRDALRDAPSVSGLYVIVFGQNRCAVPQLENAAKQYRCELAGDDPAETMTRAIITMRGWR